VGALGASPDSIALGLNALRRRARPVPRPASCKGEHSSYNDNRQEPDELARSPRSSASDQPCDAAHPPPRTALLLQHRDDSARFTPRPRSPEVVPANSCRGCRSRQAARAIVVRHPYPGRVLAVPVVPPALQAPRFARVRTRSRRVHESTVGASSAASPSRRENRDGQRAPFPDAPYWICELGDRHPRSSSSRRREPRPMRQCAARQPESSVSRIPC